VKDWVLIRKRMRMRGAYRRLFSGEGTKGDADIVLNNLLQFCHWDSTTFVRNDDGGRGMATLEGRRQVVMRILAAMRMSEEETREVITSAKKTLAKGE
jgi:hypothetical protein